MVPPPPCPKGGWGVSLPVVDTHSSDRRPQRVPVANRVLPIVRRMQAGKRPGEFLFTTAGGSQLHRTAVLRTVGWVRTGRGRRIHDLRHTAAWLWLARSVDPGTVQAWMGHESIATTNQYLHFLGTSAHAAGLERLNAPRGGSGSNDATRGQLGGNSEVTDLEQHRQDLDVDEAQE